MIDHYDVLDIEGAPCCKDCRRPLKPIYSNVGFVEEPYCQIEGFEDCTHEPL